MDDITATARAVRVGLQVCVTGTLDIRPCLVQVAVAALAHPDAQVELKAEAIIAPPEAA